MAEYYVLRETTEVRIYESLCKFNKKREKVAPDAEKLCRIGPFRMSIPRCFRIG